MTGTARRARKASRAVDDPAHRYGPGTALAVVDVQNDFADPGGGLSVKGGDAIIPAVNAEIERALVAGSVVAYTQDWHPAHTPHFAQDGGVWPVHCVKETWGARLHPALVVSGPVLRKGSGGEDGYSGFSMRDPEDGEHTDTELNATLKGAGVKRLVVAGLATDYCVLATALDGVRLGYETAVLLDCVRAVDVKPGDGERALDEMAKAGVRLVVKRSAKASRP
jgi:nicotinamidase/pyrazinamidase